MSSENELSQTTPYSIKEAKVYKEGMLTICPFAPRIPMQGKVAGAIDMVTFPCTLACPMCNLGLVEDVPSIIFSCGSINSVFPVTIEEENDDNKKNPSKLISMS